MADTSTSRRGNSAPSVIQATIPELVALARSLIMPGQRRVLGITGAPGAGKSTLTAALTAAMPEAALVPMDGFHLANAELLRLGRRDRKGAPDTFDADGYAALLGRLRQPDGQTIYAPLFDRQLEESIGSALPVSPDAPLVITEGNYLLLGTGGWERVGAAIDAVWFLEVPEALRLPRLIRRHQQFGKSAEVAEAWVQQVDEGNARLIEATRARADLVVQLVDAGQG
ncbi:nucleoside/nucleotide kinase family protein [Deinococcus sp.]|uniref:nucleoside/nucleotide kinase family protein n=1 Tax=Deinococcus sp. TaxID=47478 RepID=UPI003C7B40A1